MLTPTPLAHYLTHRPQRITLLQHIAEQGSITRAAKAAGLSYKGAWDAIDELNNLAPAPLVERSVGGKGGGGARLSADGERVLRLYQQVQAVQAQLLAAADHPEDLALLNRLMLHTSARNQLHGTVTAVIAQGRNDLITLNLGGGVSLNAQVTHASTERLALQPGTPAVALIKAGWLNLHGPDETVENSLAGTVQQVLPDAEGPTEVRINLRNGQTLCALAASDHVSALNLAEGNTVVASVDPAMVLLGTPF